RFERPDAMPLPIFRSGPYSEGDRRTLAQRAQLVPQDTRSSAVYLRFEAVHARPNVQFRDPPSAAPIEGLEFVGKVTDLRKARFLLLYPTRDKTSAPRAARQSKELAALLAPVRWVETPVKLDFAAAKSLPPPGPENPSDLRRLWAEAQANELAVLQVLAPDLPFS